MRFLHVPALLALGQALFTAVASLDLPVAARINGLESDFTTVVYNKNRPLLVGNDGGAATGGFRTFVIGNGTRLTEATHNTPGRTKLVATAYGVGARDLIVTIAQPDSFFRVYDASTAKQVGEPLTRTLGDWSALCVWQSCTSGEKYLFLFGKNQAVQFLIRESQKGTIEIVEIQTFETPIEASSCAISASAHAVFFSGDDNANIYTFNATESTEVPDITVLGVAEGDVTGLTVYVGGETDYLFVAQKDTITIYDESLGNLGSVTLTGDDDIEIEGLDVYQSATGLYPDGVVTYAIESESGAGFGISSLEGIFAKLNLESNTAYNPQKRPSQPEQSVCHECSFSGFCEPSVPASNTTICSCFAGFTGDACQSYNCRNNCSDHGACVGANQCSCDEGWGGLYCAFKTVKPAAETDANGGDGDDPAIWISPINKMLSRIITTVKSEDGAGFGVFDLSGKKIQTITAEEPNNVDVIYNFPTGDKVVDLAYAACRGDNTLWYVTIPSPS